MKIIALTILFPLIGWALLGLFGRYLNKKTITTLGVLFPALAFVATVITFINYLNIEGGFQAPEQIVKLWTFMSVGKLTIDFALQVDGLSLVMAFVITGIGSLIHIFAVGYMWEEEGISRFFSYFNLFIAAMMILVLGASLPIMFIGWEGVGLCSYLLIGFYYNKEDGVPAMAGMKAFVVNRIGDFGVLVAMLILFWQIVDSSIPIVSGNILDFVNINQFAGAVFANESWLLIIVVLLLFLGVTGKSAQIPLYVWLPDAMAGPTPVSALIHAATMVTAGVYMLARLSGLVVQSPYAMMVIAIVGALTALWAGSIAVSQYDIKKVIAYSTVSQLGFMVLACGVGAFWVGIFHVVTHAFFKACLFLGSGSVILSMHHEQDIRKMGGLAKRMPKTYVTFVLSSMALMGTPLLSGFFSKDEILWKTFSSTNEYLTKWNGQHILWIFGVIAAAFTAFYSFRLIWWTFLGEERYLKQHSSHGHEDQHHHKLNPTDGSWQLWLPLILLAIGAVLVGYLGTPAWFPLKSEILKEFIGRAASPEIVEAVKHGSKAASEGHESFMLEIGVMCIALAIAFISFLWSFATYAINKDKPAEKFRANFKWLATGSLNKWYLDEVYQWLIVRFGIFISQVICYQFIDKWVIDGIADGSAHTTLWLGNQTKQLTTGNVRQYNLMFFFGAIVVAAIVFFTFYLQQQI